MYGILGSLRVNWLEQPGGGWRGKYGGVEELPERSSDI